MSTGGQRRSSDAELAEAARGGDKDAFGELLVRHGALARQLAMRLLRDPDLAAEAVQEANVLAYLNLPRLRSPARFGPWLCGITLNLARQYLRERRRVVPVGVAANLDDALDVEDHYAAAEIAALVREAVVKLAPGQRDATLLFYWQGLTHAEVAAELGISIGAVKNRLHQGRAALAHPLATVLYDKEVPAVPATATPNWIEVSVAEVRRGESGDPALQPHVLLLQERDGGRTLPVWIGRAEATAIALTLETAEMPRPMTHQLTADLLAAAAARLREVRVTRLAEHTFYAELVLNTPAGPAVVDARPSDAVNLALITGTPITVDAALLDDARATSRHEWHEYPTKGAQLVAELRQQQQEMTARFAL